MTPTLQFRKVLFSKFEGLKGIHYVLLHLFPCRIPIKCAEFVQKGGMVMETIFVEMKIKKGQLSEGIIKSMVIRTSSFFSRSSQYLLAFGFIALVTAILFSLRDALDTTLVALLYLIPLGLITAYWGLGPGITRGPLLPLTFNYFSYQ